MFAQLGLNERLLKALAAIDITEPTPIQREAIPVVLDGKDLLASAATGTGKTAAYLLPIIHRLQQQTGAKQGTRALILAPTRELARQINKTCEKLTQFTFINCALISGGEEYKYQRAVFRKDPEIIIATPGRLLEHLEQGTPLFDYLEVLVLDEADRMLDMGFSEDVLSIAGYCHAQRQTLLFSATLKQQAITHLADHILSNPERVDVEKAANDTANIHQQVILSDDISHKEKLLLWLAEHEPYKKLLVFSNTKLQANRLRGILRGKKFKAAALHSEMKQKERTSTMSAFRNGAVKVLVATDVASRGLDVMDVDLVINFDLVRHVDDYVHRIGRTGRAGQEGTAISFVTPRDWNMKATLERYLKETFEHRTIKALQASYKGPKKLKSSGKAAGTKKKKTATDKTKSPRKKASIKKRVTKGDLQDGFAPMKKKKRPMPPELND